MLTKKKKIFILFGMVALLVLTGVLNIVLNRLNGDAANDANGEQNGDFFAMYRASRIAEREETLAILDSIINNEASTAAQKEDATNQKAAIAAANQMEMTLEGLIIARGFSDAIVTNTTQNINVLVKSSELNEAQVAQIQTILQDEVKGLDLNTVRIIPIEG